MSDIWSQKTEYYDDGVKFGTGPEMIAEIKSLSRKLEEARHRIAELADLKNEASFLVDRLREWEADGCDCDRGNREWNGHVSPPLARLEGILSKLEGKSPNAETLAAMQELEDGGTEKFATVDDLMKDLNDDELEGKSDA